MADTVLQVAGDDRLGGKDTLLVGACTVRMDEVAAGNTFLRGGKCSAPKQGATLSLLLPSATAFGQHK